MQCRKPASFYDHLDDAKSSREESSPGTLFDLLDAVDAADRCPARRRHVLRAEHNRVRYDAVEITTHQRLPLAHQISLLLPRPHTCRSRSQETPDSRVR